MTDDTGFFRNLAGYANDWVAHKRRILQSGPSTKVDSSGSRYSVSFGGQDINRSDLRKIKKIRESGGIITSAYDAKALIRFGTGAEFQTENDAVREWLEANFEKLDLLVLEMGEDATYYPYSLGETVENMAGGFSHIEHIQPWTMLPITDEYGEIVAWEQEIQGSTQTFEPEEVGSIVLNKSSGRDKTGISDVLQNKEEIETFRANQKAMREATERIGYPFVHAKVGREGAAQINDNELRRVRDRIKDIGPGETQVTGRDVDIDLKDPATVDFAEIQERDTRMLSNAISLPIEMLNEGSDGLGSGKPAEARLSLFALQNEAARRRFAAQFIEEYVYPILREYSPFDPGEVDVSLHIKPFLDDKTDMVELISKVGDYMSANEVRDKLEMEPIEDEEVGESYRTPAEMETPEEEQGGGFDDLFSERMQTELESRGLTKHTARNLQEDFDASLFELVATEEQEDFETGARLGVGVEFPNSGVYVDWNIDAWPEDERLDGPHVSEYATVEDAQSVAQGEVRELSAGEFPGDTDFRLSEDERAELEDWEVEYLDLFDRVWSVDSDKQLFQFRDTALPDFVKENIRSAILSGSVFSDIQGIAEQDLIDFQTFLADELTDDSWTIDNVTEELMDIEETLDKSQAETIVRTESAAAVNKARADEYEERYPDARFYWSGSLDDRTTTACETLIKDTNPNHGGTPVPMDELKDKIEQAVKDDPDLDDDMARPEVLVAHINERKTATRFVE